MSDKAQMRRRIARLVARVAELETAIHGHIDGDFCHPGWAPDDPLNAVRCATQRQSEEK